MTYPRENFAMCEYQLPLLWASFMQHMHCKNVSAWPMFSHRQELTFQAFGKSVLVDLAGARRRLHLRIRGFSSSLRFGRPCGPGWRSTPRTAVSQPATQPCDRGIVNIQALERGDTLLLIVAAHPSTPATNKQCDELRWPTKPLEGT